MHCQLPCWPLCACLVLGGLYTFQSLCLASASFSTFNVCNFLRSPRLFPPPPPPGGCRPALPSGLFRPCRLRGPALPALPGPALPVARPWVLVPWPWPRFDTHFGVWKRRSPASIHVPYKFALCGRQYSHGHSLLAMHIGLNGPHCVCRFCRAVAWKCMLLVCLPFVHPLSGPSRWCANA